MPEDTGLFKTILVPLDFAKENRSSVDAAVQLTQEGGEVVLLHVIEPIRDLSFEELRTFYEKLERDARGHLEDVAVKVESPSVEVKREIIYGRRADEILVAARSHEADLIILNSHPLKPDATAESFGSISFKVGLISECPVLLMR